MLKFSVAMCVYIKDNPVWFDEALESVVNQTAKPDEIVVVADGPLTDELNAVIEKYLQYNLKPIYLPENKGQGEARRISLENCSYPLVAIMDADDICVPTRFAQQLQCFEEDDSLTIVGGNIDEFIHQPTNIVSSRIVPSEDNAIKEYMKKRCPFNQVSVMFKLESVQQVGGYIDWFWEEDYYLWIRLYLAGATFKNIPSVLVNVRVGEDMYRRRGGLKYYRSEKRLQKFMLKSKIIGFGTYFMNCTKRFIVQVLMPNKLRGWVFKKFARTKVKKDEKV